MIGKSEIKEVLGMWIDTSDSASFWLSVLTDLKAREVKDELKDKIQFYLKNDSAREKIANNGYERCRKSGYDIYSRMKQWYDDVNFFMENK